MFPLLASFIFSGGESIVGSDAHTYLTYLTPPFLLAVNLWGLLLWGLCLRKGTYNRRFYSRWRKQRLGNGLQRLRRRRPLPLSIWRIWNVRRWGDQDGGHPCITGLPGGARFQFGRWRDLEEVEDLGRFRIELSPQILVLKSRPAQFLRLWP